MPNADRELRRDLDALSQISPDCTRDEWRKILAGIADRHLGSDFGRGIAVAWSHGGSALDVRFREPTGPYTTDDFEACWRDACRNPHFGIGTVFHFAKQAGWNSSRARWGLGRVQRPQRVQSAAASQVHAAGLKMPPHLNLGRIAWFWHLLKTTRRPDLLQVGFVIAFSINTGAGFCWRTLEAISRVLGWPRGRKGDGFMRASRSVRDLALLGFIVRSPGNERGAHGRIGSSFALTPPDAMTWEACIASYQTDFGARSNVSPELATAGTAPVGSEAQKCGSDPPQNQRVGAKSEWQRPGSRPIGPNHSHTGPASGHAGPSKYEIRSRGEGRRGYCPRADRTERISGPTPAASGNGPASCHRRLL
jgi:hypothetical protein